VNNAVAYHKSKFVILIRFEPSELSMANMLGSENGLAPLIVMGACGSTVG
jgi:hypothetical protein